MAHLKIAQLRHLLNQNITMAAAIIPLKAHKANVPTFCTYNEFLNIGNSFRIGNVTEKYLPKEPIVA